MNSKLFTAAFCVTLAGSPVAAKDCAVVKINSLTAIKYSEGSDNSVISAFTTMAAAFANAQGASSQEIGETLSKQKDPEIAAAGALIAGAGGTEKAFAAAITGLPDLISAIDKSSDTPDDLYLTLSSSPDDDAAFWPAPGEDSDEVRTEAPHPTQGIRSVVPYVMGLQGGSGGREITVNFFDWDSPSADDHLGSVTFHISDAGEGPQNTVMLGAKHGGVIYTLEYDVVPVTCNFSVAPILRHFYASSASKGASPREAILFTGLMEAALIELGAQMGDYKDQF